MPVIITLEAVTLANVGLNPFAIFWANDAVVACEADIANEAEVATLDEIANDELTAWDADVANEAEVATEALVAKDDDTAVCACDADTACEADVANEAEVAFTTLFITLVNVVPSPLVYVIVSLVLDAVRTLFNANDAVEANDELTVEPVATVTGNVEPSPLVNVITLLTALAVTNNEPVLTVVPAFKANEAVTANDAEVACEADVACDAEVAVVANEALVDVVAKLALVAVVANEADVALFANEAVIDKLPVIVFPKPSCNSLPLICVMN